MGVNRWVARALLSAVLSTLPACVIHADKFDPGPPPADATRAATDFGIYPRAPGEFVAKHPTAEPATKPDLVAARPPADPPVPLPDIPPPPAAAAPPEPPLVLAVRAYLDNRPDVAVEYLNALEKPNQELMLRLLPAVVQVWQPNFGKAGPHEVGVLADQLEQTAAGLIPRSPLRVEKACFTRAKVQKFGEYDPYPERPTFRPRSLVQAYVELRNVAWEPTVDPAQGSGYATRLTCTLELRDAVTGTVIEMTDRHERQVPKLVEEKRDFARSPLRDYYVPFRLSTPSKPGTYVVTLEVRDAQHPQSDRAVSKPMTFKVQ